MTSELLVFGRLLLPTFPTEDVLFLPHVSAGQLGGTLHRLESASPICILRTRQT